MSASEPRQQDLEGPGGVRIHLRRSGSGRPLLLLHGVTDSGAAWDQVAALLADGFDVVAADARGHGRSSRIESAFSVVDLAEDAAAVIRDAFGGGPALVWGHSMGAGTAAVLAAEHPDLVAAVVLEDPPFRVGSGGDDALEGIRTMVRLVQEAQPEQRQDLASSMNPDWDATELPGWVGSKLEFDPAVLDHRIVGDDWRTTVARIAAPVLLVTGDPGRGAIVTPAVAEELAALRPGLLVQRFDGAGHNVHRESSDVLTAVREFLTAHGADPARDGNVPVG